MNFWYNDEENRLGLGAVDVKKMRRGSFFSYDASKTKKIKRLSFLFYKMESMVSGKKLTI